jgi:hypothetical protein
MHRVHEGTVAKATKAGLEVDLCRVDNIFVKSDLRHNPACPHFNHSHSYTHISHPSLHYTTLQSHLALVFRL